MVKIGIACGGGGELAVAYAAGCAAAIWEETGWDAGTADIVIGTSGGAIIATALRVGLAPLDAYNAMVGEPLSAAGKAHLGPGVLGAHGNEANEVPPMTQNALTDARLNSPTLLLRALRHPLSLNPITLAAALLPEGRLSHEFVRAKMISMTENKWPRHRLGVIATELSTGARRMFTRDTEPNVEIATAVSASCAVPAVFDPVIIDDVKYVDGGLASSTNAEMLPYRSLDLVLSFAPLSTHSTGEGRILAPMRLECRRAADGERDRIQKAGTACAVFHPDHESIEAMGLNLMDVTHRGPVARAARAAALNFLRSPDGEQSRDLLQQAAQERHLT